MAFQTTYAPDGRLRVAILGCTGSIGTQRSMFAVSMPTVCR
mgnify:FL=1